MNNPIEVDLCIVTKNPKAIDMANLHHIPFRNIIIETSKPLARARLNAILKVTSRWFIFLDDDVHVGERWFDQVTSHISADVGAIEGGIDTAGLGEKWDKSYNAYERKNYELKMGECGVTWNTLIWTDIVNDWKPSNLDLPALEDFELSQHVLRKGFRWIRVEAEGYHMISWRKLFDSGLVCGKALKMFHKKRSEALKKFLSLCLTIMSTIKQKMIVRTKIIYIYRSLIIMAGLIF